MGTIAVPFFMGEPMAGFDVPEPFELLSPTLPQAEPQQRMAMLYGALAARVAAVAEPVIYAGDCVSIIGVLAGLERIEIRPTLVFFDAHGDFNTWETSPSGFLGGMPLAMITGRGEQTIVGGAGLSRVADERIVLVDGRDLDPGEDTAIADSGIRHTTVPEVTAHIPERGPLYVHVDGDVVDPADMPAMNYPAPGGPNLEEVASAVAALAATGRVVAFSISSWNPALPGADVAAAAMLRIAAPFVSSS